MDDAFYISKACGNFAFCQENDCVAGIRIYIIFTKRYLLSNFYWLLMETVGESAYKNQSNIFACLSVRQLFQSRTIWCLCLDTKLGSGIDFDEISTKFSGQGQNWLWLWLGQSSRPKRGFPGFSNLSDLMWNPKLWCEAMTSCDARAWLHTTSLNDDSEWDQYTYDERTVKCMTQEVCQHWGILILGHSK